jgi:hypothetical protein
MPRPSEPDVVKPATCAHIPEDSAQKSGVGRTFGVSARCPHLAKAVRGNRVTHGGAGRVGFAVVRNALPRRARGRLPAPRMTAGLERQLGEPVANMGAAGGAPTTLYSGRGTPIGIAIKVTSTGRQMTEPRGRCRSVGATGHPCFRPDRTVEDRGGFDQRPLARHQLRRRRQRHGDEDPEVAPAQGSHLPRTHRGGTLAPDLLWERTFRTTVCFHLTGGTGS